MKSRICLNMIVKDEAHVIARCLASVRDHIDSWVIVDTGSTDATKALIAQCLAGIPGELHERPWRDFGSNRTEALELAREHADYLFFIDADDIFHAPAGWKWPTLTADAYDLDCRRLENAYTSRLLVSTSLRWRYVGVLHEYIDRVDGGHVAARRLPGPWVDRRTEGARSRDPEKYRKDALMLEKAFALEPGNTRYAFYLAQSWRDADEPLKALEWYQQRARMGGWDEEVWYATFQAALLVERTGGNDTAVRAAYEDAYELRPTRAEPLVELARYHRQHGRHALACLHALRAAEIPRPADCLFVDEAAYRWRALDEVGASAYWVGEMELGRSSIERLLALHGAPAPELGRLLDNLSFYRHALGDMG